MSSLEHYFLGAVPEKDTKRANKKNRAADLTTTTLWGASVSRHVKMGRGVNPTEAAGGSEGASAAFILASQAALIAAVLVGVLFAGAGAIADGSIRK